jgi:hypothetical protein
MRTLSLLALTSLVGCGGLRYSPYDWAPVPVTDGERSYIGCYYLNVSAPAVTEQALDWNGSLRLHLDTLGLVYMNSQSPPATADLPIKRRAAAVPTPMAPMPWTAMWEMSSQDSAQVTLRSGREGQGMYFSLVRVPSSDSVRGVGHQNWEMSGRVRPIVVAGQRITCSSARA